eukprot:13338076-Alexandrium_andersonii.AAC.1
MPARAPSVGKFPRDSGEAAALPVSANLATRPARCGSEAALSQSHAACPMAPTSQHLSAAESMIARGSPPAGPRMRW